MTVSIPFQQQTTFRKLGYMYFTDSLSYREVLEQNPQWTVTELPPVGAQLRIRGTSDSTGGLVQGDFLFGPAANGLNIDIYPYETEESYVKALVKYSPSAVANREKINGYAMDSEVTTVGG
jgi:hypothetical protein